jgi:rare lipoprotein A
MSAKKRRFPYPAMLLFLLTTACSSSSVKPTPPETDASAARATSEIKSKVPPHATYLESGTASWYGPQFDGRKTANGEKYDMNDLTAAHPTLPFGTKVYVRNPRTGKSVVVRINDRGPYVHGRIIDLSRAAARRLGMVNNGTSHVTLWVAKR